MLEVLSCYEEIQEKIGWSDSEVLLNFIRLMYVVYCCGQVKLLNEWFKDYNC